MSKFRRKLFVLVLSSLTFVALLSYLVSLSHEKGEKIRIGAKNCTEQHFLAEMLALLFEEHTDIAVERRFNLEGTAIAFEALKSGSIDLYFEYTGTAFLDILKEKEFPFDLYHYLKRCFADRFSLEWLEKVGFCNQYALIVRRGERYQTISDLKKEKGLRVAFDPEFTMRIDYELLQASYPKASFNKPRLMDQVLLYFSLLNGGVDVISGATTDGRLVDERLVALHDDEGCLPKYEVAPLVSQEALKRFPKINDMCALLTGAITDEEMRALNYEVEFAGSTVKKLALQFLEKKGLIPLKRE